MKKKITLSSFNVSVVLLMFFVFGSVNLFGQSNNCDAEIGVLQNRNTRSVTPSGTYYKMILTNNSLSSDTYIFTSEDINQSCTNTDGSSTANNVILNYSFLDFNQSPISEVVLKPGESFKFLVFVTVPIGTVINSWSCANIIGASKTCDNYSVNTILHTRVIDPSQD